MGLFQSEKNKMEIRRAGEREGLKRWHSWQEDTERLITTTKGERGSGEREGKECKPDLSWYYCLLLVHYYSPLATTVLKMVWYPLLISDTHDLIFSLTMVCQGNQNLEVSLEE